MNNCLQYFSAFGGLLAQIGSNSNPLQHDLYTQWFCARQILDRQDRYCCCLIAVGLTFIVRCSCPLSIFLVLICAVLGAWEYIFKCTAAISTVSQPHLLLSFCSIHSQTPLQPCLLFIILCLGFLFKVTQA